MMQRRPGNPLAAKYFLQEINHKTSYYLNCLQIPTNSEAVHKLLIRK